MGLKATRPPAMMAAMATQALRMAWPMDMRNILSCSCPPTLPEDWDCARRGVSIRKTTTARSWKSRTLKVALPCREDASPLSCRTCRATAVDESAMAAPKMTAPGPLRPSALTPSHTAISIVTATCENPSPNTYFCIAWSLSKESSSPMLKRRKITPSSAMCLTAFTLLMIPRAFGPIRAPPSKNPSTGDPPGSLAIRGTTTTHVARRYSVSSMPDSLPWASSSTTSPLALAFFSARSSLADRTLASFFPVLDLILSTTWVWNTWVTWVT
mmetsp:Transcript_32461/g.70032  ORF Transcript_32461/g.70032 Transcript_32461/m.70032 type:complete len:270 (-) Transcript_32461:100-909(-)